MKFSGITTASARLRAQAHRRDLEKEAMVGALLKGGLNVGRKLVGGAAKTVARGAAAPVTAPAKGFLNYAKRKPLQAGFLALTAVEGVSQSRKVAKGFNNASGAVRQQGRMGEAMRHAQRISPEHDIAPMPRF